ncbi:unnamed protein product [Clonostachys solani]|uniref:Uncharacterized protein n=1 Tax=Clonostachys solani TaxID=160281 RepID=A0A9N9W476_9HYPO|nr:unnamed protein product [Clonostachys solani]
MSLLLTFWKLHDLLGFWSLGGFQTALGLSNAVFRISFDGHARLYSIEQLWLHQALKIDGRYYELTWMHFFADSTKLSDSAVEEDESYAQGEDDADGNATSRRTILSERCIGQTYMTREEILQTGNELIKTSPGYDLFSYNCTWLRHNLFLRIKYDGSAEQKNPFLRRSSLASQLPYYDFLPLIARYIYALASASDESSYFWQNPASGLLWIVFELLMLSMEARAVVVWSSTVLCRVYRSRMIVPIAIGILFLQHAYQHLNDGRLFSWYSPVYGDNMGATMALIYYTMMPITTA